jgi:hypothetical protein
MRNCRYGFQDSTLPRLVSSYRRKEAEDGVNWASELTFLCNTIQQINRL